MRIGIFGGSFDPIHMGHLLLAEQCLENGGLDRIKFIPAAQPPHKLDRVLLDANRRSDMVRLAIAGHPAFELDLREIERDGVSFTVDTLESLQNDTDQLFLLMGGDSLDDFHTWKDPKQICELATPIVYQRPGIASDLEILQSFATDTKMKTIRSLAFAAIPIGISSSHIRESLGKGKSIRFQTTRAVEEYIREHKLYQ